jgi:TonB family protein
MRNHLLCGLLLVSASVSVGAPEPLKPLKSWDLDYGETQCIAYRSYGDAAKPITLAVRPSPNGATYEILVGVLGPAPDSAEELLGTVDFSHGPIKAWLLHYRPTTTKLNIYQFRISAEDMSQARSAHMVRLHVQNLADFEFELALMPQLLDGLDGCVADLKRYWNMDGEKDGRIAKPAKGDVRRVFASPDDYPAEALRRGQEGDAQYLLLVDQNGKVAGCHVLLPSGVPILDAMGCVVIQNRAKFTPAFDAKGKPVRSTVVTPKIRWRTG